MANAGWKIILKDNPADVTWGRSVKACFDIGAGASKLALTRDWKGKASLASQSKL